MLYLPWSALHRWAYIGLKAAGLWRRRFADGRPRFCSEAGRCCLACSSIDWRTSISLTGWNARIAVFRIPVDVDCIQLLVAPTRNASCTSPRANGPFLDLLRYGSRCVACGQTSLCISSCRALYLCRNSTRRLTDGIENLDPVATAAVHASSGRKAPIRW